MSYRSPFAVRSAPPPRLVLRVGHRHLRVVALLESLVARRGDRSAFRVREVALRFLVRLAIARLYGRPPADPAPAADPARRPPPEPPLPDGLVASRIAPDALLADATPPADRRPEPRPARVLGLVNRIRLSASISLSRAVPLPASGRALIALRLLAFARRRSIASPSAPDPTPAPDGPPPRTAPGNPPGADAETRTASGVAESCPPPAPGTPTSSSSSERPGATRTPPSRGVEQWSPSPSSEAHTARCDGRPPRTERRTPSIQPSTRSLTWCAKWPSGTTPERRAAQRLVSTYGMWSTSSPSVVGSPTIVASVFLRLQTPRPPGASGSSPPARGPPASSTAGFLPCPRGADVTLWRLARDRHRSSPPVRGLRYQLPASSTVDRLTVWPFGQDSCVSR